MKISVVIPVLNEAPRIAGVVQSLRRQDPDCEIIVVDGGSEDMTLERAEQAGALTFVSARGRGQQLAFGAAQSNGDVILFLHADTQLPKGGLPAIRQCLKAPAIVGGNFRIRFTGETDFAAWLTGFYARFRRRGLYYGDSAIFVRRCIYDAIGGMKPIDLMEDYEFTRRLERAGKTACIDSPAVETSSRRFDGRRPIAIVSGWIVIHILFHLGVPPRFLAYFYDSARRRHSRPSPTTERIQQQSDRI